MAKKKAKFDIYEAVTDRIIAKLEEGTVPWQKPWRDGAVSWEKQRPYTGVNTLLLEPGEYATFKAIQKAGGKVKKGEKGHLVVFWKWLKVKDEDEDGEERRKRKPSPCCDITRSGR